MKYVLVATIAAVIGGLTGSLASVFMTRVHAEGPAELVEGKEIVLLDRGGKPAARLMNDSGNTLLRFYNEDSSVALEMGVGREYAARYIHFLGKDGLVRAGLSTMPNGNTSLFLSNRPGGTEVILGAFPDDEPRDDPTREWGLEFKGASSKPTFSVLVKSSEDLSPVRAAISLIRQSGELWEVH